MGKRHFIFHAVVSLKAETQFNLVLSGSICLRFQNQTSQLRNLLTSLKSTTSTQLPPAFTYRYHVLIKLIQVK